ncbi:Sterol 3-beta-glucosyltransferase [Polyrhizophydium stewartii]|uniref:sterol 3beta-glucosyltransferase n=1 Tax=Polyrhizophydium stewartii TaxID=2732419 RepID=A0ABR4NKW4_9FUNG
MSFSQAIDFIHVVRAESAGNPKLYTDFLELLRSSHQGMQPLSKLPSLFTLASLRPLPSRRAAAQAEAVNNPLLHFAAVALTLAEESDEALATADADADADADAAGAPVSRRPASHAGSDDPSSIHHVYRHAIQRSASLVSKAAARSLTTASLASLAAHRFGSPSKAESRSRISASGREVTAISDDDNDELSSVESFTDSDELEHAESSGSFAAPGAASSQPAIAPAADRSSSLQLPRSQSTAKQHGVRIQKPELSIAEKIKIAFELPEVEEYRGEFACWLVRSVMLRGYMFLTDKHICFYTSLDKSQRDTKAGFLKRQSSTGLFSTYWFVLKRDVLYWYNNSTDLYYPVSNILLRNIVDIIPSKSRATVFKIRTNRKLYVFEADTETLRSEWISVLRAAIFRGRNIGDDVRVVFPLAAVSDISVTKTTGLDDSLRIKVVDSDFLLAEEYYFAYFNDIAKTYEILVALLNEGRHAAPDQSDSIAKLPVPGHDMPRKRSGILYDSTTLTNLPSLSSSSSGATTSTALVVSSAGPVATLPARASDRLSGTLRTTTAAIRTAITSVASGGGGAAVTPLVDTTTQAIETITQVATASVSAVTSATNSVANSVASMSDTALDKIASMASAVRVEELTGVLRSSKSSLKDSTGGSSSGSRTPPASPMLAARWPHMDQPYQSRPSTGSYESDSSSSGSVQQYQMQQQQQHQQQPQQQHHSQHHYHESKRAASVDSHITGSVAPGTASQGSYAGSLAVQHSAAQSIPSHDLHDEKSELPSYETIPPPALPPRRSHHALAHSFPLTSNPEPATPMHKQVLQHHQYRQHQHHQHQHHQHHQHHPHQQHQHHQQQPIYPDLKTLDSAQSSSQQSHDSLQTQSSHGPRQAHPSSQSHSHSQQALSPMRREADERRGWWGHRKTSSDGADVAAAASAAAAHEQRNHEFRQLFPVPDTETLQLSYSCYLDRVLPRLGKIYISDNFVCFKSKVIGVRATVVLPMSEIVHVSKLRRSRSLYYTLVLRMHTQEEIKFDFNTTESRDRCYDALHDLLSITSAGELGDPSDSDHSQLRKPSLLDESSRQEKHAKVEFHRGEIAYIPPVLDAEPVKPAKSMHITCLTIGTRGDVQPYIALCKAFMADGHRCRLATHLEYKEWIEGFGIEFFEVKGNPAELMQLCVDHGMFTVSFIREGMTTFRSWIDELLVSCWQASQNTDLLIESPTAMGGIHCAERLGIPYFAAFPMPWTRTKQYPHPFAVPEYHLGSGYNLMSHVLIEQIFQKGVGPQVNRWRRTMLDAPPMSLSVLSEHKYPFLYSFSPSVVPQPPDWQDWIHTCGYWFLDNPEHNWTPPASLTAFMGSGPKPVYIGFGSIIVPDPDALTRTIVEAVKKAGVRAILSKGWSARLPKVEHAEPTSPAAGGSAAAATAAAAPEAPIEYPDCIYPLDKVPHDWLFPQMAGVVHHGGAGTTAAGIRAGVPTLIRPFFGDQFFWADRVQDLGVGISLRKLTVDKLSAALVTLTSDATMRERAALLGEKVRAERGVANAVQYVYRDLEFSRKWIHELAERNKRSAGNITEWWRPYDSACRTGIAAFDIAWRPFVVSWILVSALGCLFVTYCNVSMLRRNGWAVRGVRHMCLMAINGAALLKLVFYSYNPYCVYDGCDTNAVRILFDGTYWCFMLAYALMGVHWISIFYTFMHLTPIDTLLIARAVALVYVVFVVALEIVLSVMAMNTDLKYAVLIVEGGTLVLILLSVVPMYFLYGLRFIQRLRNVRADKSGRRERMLSKIRVMTYGPSVCSAVFIILQGAKFTVLHTNPFWFLIGECLGNSIEFIVMSLFLDGILLREQPDAVPSLAERLWDITTAYVPLTYTSFGGPQVHIAMYIHEFVEKRKWLPSNVFAELFAIAQALPGPASTQLGYSIGLIRGGVAGGLLSFFIWSFPCMIIMMGFGIGVSQLGSSLPPVVLYLQNGLTSAAVGLVALAAYKLCTKLLADRICSAIGAVSAILAINLYKQAWLFPVLMIAGGTVTFIEAQIAAAAERRAREQAAISSSEARDEARALQPGSTADSGAQTPKSGSSGSGAADESTFFKVRFSYSPRTGLVLLGIWAVLLVVAIVLRGIDAPRPLSVLGTLYFVGSIIFGGGPVVIPLLQNYVVTNGWLSDSEFLIGLAIINAMPGPNFNIAAYVGALALRDSVGASIGGALLGNIGIFLPGLLLMSGLMPLWNQYRALKSVQSVFRGVNAAAVGLVVAAIYLLGQKTITPPHSSGLGIVEPLTDHPIYIGVAIFSYTASGFLGLPTPLAIILGGIFGIIHWGISR